MPGIRIVTLRCSGGGRYPGPVTLDGFSLLVVVSGFALQIAQG